MQRTDAISAVSELGGLSKLSRAAAQREPAAIDAVARRFEALFAEMMVASMRSASLGDPLFEGQNSLYRELYDRELAARMTAGRGLGIADMLRRQLGAPTVEDSPPQAQASAGRAPADVGAAASAARSAPPPAIAAQAPGIASAPTTAPWLTNYVPDLQLDAIAAASGFEPVDAVFGAATPAVPVSAPARPSVPANLVGPKAGTPEAFVAEVWPHAKAAAAQLGVDPRMLVAQAALETGWGRSVMRSSDGSSSHNVFGIKASGGWRGQSVNQGTFEFRDGIMQRERASFRAYGSVSESFADYVRLVRDNPRYRDALESGGDGARFADALARAGYATDPQYADKLKAIAGGPTLRRALAQLPLAETHRA